MSETTTTDTGGSAPPTGSVDAAAAAFDSILAGGDADTRRAPKAKAADNAAPDPDDGEGEAQQDESTEADETPDGGDAEEGDADADESGDESDPDAGDQPAPLDLDNTRVTVRVDGKAQEVSVAEAVRGYQRQQDYSRKTAALADERRSFESERSAIQRERAQYGELLTELERMIAQEGVEAPDFRLLDTDPIEFTRRKAIYDARQTQLQAARAEKERLSQARRHEDAQRMAELRRAEWQRLVEAEPAFRDEAAWNRAKASIVEFGRKVGFSGDDLTKAGHDHRIVLTLQKAAAYDKLMQGKPRPAPSAKDAPRAAPPSSKSAAPRPASEITRAKQRLAQTHSVADAAAVFAKLL